MSNILPEIQNSVLAADFALANDNYMPYKNIRKRKTRSEATIITKIDLSEAKVKTKETSEAKSRC